MNYGRLPIITPYKEVTDDNIKEILECAFTIFTINNSDMDFLFGYYRGMQPILHRQKHIRPEICNMVVENHAYEIVNFRTGYLLEKPIQYVALSSEVDDVSLSIFNGYNTDLSKESQDMEIAQDQAICGTAYRLVLPNDKYDGKFNDIPYTIDRIDPRQAFVVYSSALGNKALLGVVVLIEKDENNNTVFVLQAYSKDTFYVYKIGGVLVSKTTHAYGTIPLIEYPHNRFRLGAFEPVIPMLDAINTIQSNRVDGIEQFIQALLVFKNVEIKKEMLQQLQELGAINISDNGEITASVEYLQQELKQDQVQTLIDYLVSTVYKIAGLPSRTKNGSGDTGQAVLFRDGWTEIESKIQDTELSFKKSEREFIKIALNYTRTITLNKVNLPSRLLEIKFTRRNYENIVQKTTVLTQMLGSDKIAPRLAFVVCGLFQDPEAAYQESQEYAKSLKGETDATESE